MNFFITLLSIISIVNAEKIYVYNHKRQQGNNAVANGGQATDASVSDNPYVTGYFGAFTTATGTDSDYYETVSYDMSVGFDSTRNGGQFGQDYTYTTSMSTINSAQSLVTVTSSGSSSSSMMSGSSSGSASPSSGAAKTVIISLGSVGAVMLGAVYVL